MWRGYSNTYPLTTGDESSVSTLLAVKVLEFIVLTCQGSPHQLRNAQRKAACKVVPSTKNSRLLGCPYCTHSPIGPIRRIYRGNCQFGRPDPDLQYMD